MALTGLELGTWIVGFAALLLIAAGAAGMFVARRLRRGRA
jgi:hypothetical protein